MIDLQLGGKDAKWDVVSWRPRSTSHSGDMLLMADAPWLQYHPEEECPELMQGSFTMVGLNSKIKGWGRISVIYIQSVST